MAKDTRPTAAPLRARVFTALFCALVGLPFLVFNLFSSRLSLDNHENRLLTTLPQVLASAPKEFLPNLNTFLLDNSPFRYQFVLLDAGLDYRLFGTVQNDQVLAGRDGWLFYKAGPDAARPMADYQGLPARNDSAQTLADAAAALQRLSDALAARGCTLVLDLAPAKERVYREYMPAGYPIVDEANRTDRFAAYMAENTAVPVNWRYAQLRAQALAAPDLLLYNKTDTHWNAAGALLGLDGVFTALGMPTLPFAEYRFAEGEPRTGDMANVAALYTLLPPDAQPVAQDYGALFAPDARTVAVYGDSFTWSYVEYLSLRFAGATREELEALTPEALAGVQADVLILEATERNLDLLLEVLARF